MVLTIVGKTKIATDINTAFPYCAIGEGITAANKAHTTLESEAMRVASTNVLVTTTDADDTAQQTATFSIVASLAITNSAMFAEASAGTMLCEQVFSEINVVNGDALTVVWKEVVS